MEHIEKNVYKHWLFKLTCLSCRYLLCMIVKTMPRASQMSRSRCAKLHPTMLGALVEPSWTRLPRLPITSKRNESAPSSLTELTMMTIAQYVLPTHWYTHTPYRQDFVEVMDMIDRRLNDKGKNWRHVFKVTNTGWIGTCMINSLL
jgi:hypothetical protein